MPTGFKELLELFNSHQVEYILVGAYALAFHGAPRFTGDLDIFVKPDAPNSTRVMAALSDFGFGSIGLSIEDFVKADQVTQLGVPPVRIDLITGISGVSWDRAAAGSMAANLDGIPVRFIGRADLSQTSARQAARRTSPIWKHWENPD